MPAVTPPTFPPTPEARRRHTPGGDPLVDRSKEFIKYKGARVAPAKLLAHPNVADAAVGGSPDEEAGEVPKAFVVANGEAAAGKIVALVAERVAPHKKVRNAEFVGGSRDRPRARSCAAS